MKGGSERGDVGVGVRVNKGDDGDARNGRSTTLNKTGRYSSAHACSLGEWPFGPAGESHPERTRYVANYESTQEYE